MQKVSCEYYALIIQLLVRTAKYSDCRFDVRAKLKSLNFPKTTTKLVKCYQKATSVRIKQNNITTKFHKVLQNLRSALGTRSFVFSNTLRFDCYWIWGQYTFSRSNTALDGPRINQSHCGFVVRLLYGLRQQDRHFWKYETLQSSRNLSGNIMPKNIINLQWSGPVFRVQMVEKIERFLVTNTSRSRRPVSKVFLLSVNLY